MLNIRETKNEADEVVKEVLISNRLYIPLINRFVGYKSVDDEAEKEDEDKRNFYGWSNTRHEEWLVVVDPRIAKYLFLIFQLTLYRKDTMSKRPLNVSKYSSLEDNLVDDSNDHIYNTSDEKIYAITRQGFSKSTFMVNMINNFGELGGFQKILDRIQHTENWAPIELVSPLIGVIGNMSPLLHKEFAYEYLPKLKEAIWKNLLQSPESNIRNFTKDRLEDILQGLDVILKRVYTVAESNEVKIISLYSYI